MAKAAALPDFEGHEVRKALLRITGAGDGLSEALALEPKAYHHGQEVAFVLKGVVDQVNHKPVEKGGEDLARVHTVVAVDVAEVDLSDIKVYLEDQAERTRLARDAAAGQEQLPIQPETKKGGVSVVEDPDSATD